MEAREELRTLPKELATKVARHLVMAGRLAEDEPEQAYRHAKAARRLASRVGIVREAAGIAAYHGGEWAEALAELRAARRLGAGDYSYLPVMADCERGLGRPERALDLIKSPEAEKLDPTGRVELRIVESGVRRDMGQNDAAVVTLQIPELRDRRLRPWSVRLFYAYADALVEAGREGEASDWFARAAAADRDGDTDAAERYAELEGLQILDTEEDEDFADVRAGSPPERRRRTLLKRRRRKFPRRRRRTPRRSRWRNPPRRRSRMPSRLRRPISRSGPPSPRCWTHRTRARPGCPRSSWSRSRPTRSGRRRTDLRYLTGG